MLHNTSGRKHWSRVRHQEPPHTYRQYSPARSDARPQSPVPRSRGGFIENMTPSPIPALARTRGYTFDTLALAELVRSSDAHLQNTFSQDPLLCRVEACVVWSMRLITVSLSESALGNPEPFSGGITFILYLDCNLSTSCSYKLQIFFTTTSPFNSALIIQALNYLPRGQTLPKDRLSYARPWCYDCSDEADEIISNLLLPAAPLPGPAPGC